MRRISVTAASSGDAVSMWSMRGGLAQQAADLAAGVGREVAADPGAQVGGLADVEARARWRRGTGRRPGARGRRSVRASLAACGWAAMRGQREQVVEGEHAERRGPLEQQVEQVGGGEGVVEGAVAGAVVEAEAVGQRAELAVGDLVADQAAGQRRRCRP